MLDRNHYLGFHHRMLSCRDRLGGKTPFYIGLYCVVFWVACLIFFVTLNNILHFSVEDFLSLKPGSFAYAFGTYGDNLSYLIAFGVLLSLMIGYERYLLRDNVFFFSYPVRSFLLHTTPWAAFVVIFVLMIEVLKQYFQGLTQIWFLLIDIGIVLFVVGLVFAFSRLESSSFRFSTRVQYLLIGGVVALMALGNVLGFSYAPPQEIRLAREDRLNSRLVQRLLEGVSRYVRSTGQLPISLDALNTTHLPGALWVRKNQFSYHVLDKNRVSICVPTVSRMRVRARLVPWVDWMQGRVFCQTAVFKKDLSGNHVMEKQQ